MYVCIYVSTTVYCSMKYAYFKSVDNILERYA